MTHSDLSTYNEHAPCPPPTPSPRLHPQRTRPQASTSAKRQDGAHRQGTIGNRLPRWPCPLQKTSHRATRSTAGREKKGNSRPRAEVYWSL